MQKLMHPIDDILALIMYCYKPNGNEIGIGQISISSTRC
jgi:hypothetical protein